MLDLVENAGSVLDEECAAIREEIERNVSRCRMTRDWLPRNSQSDQQRADALTRIGRGQIAPQTLARAGLTAEVWYQMKTITRLIKTAVDAGPEMQALAGAPYRPMVGLRNVYARQRRIGDNASA